jgi:hypothetical protein
MAWHVVSFPPSARALLPRNREGDFSPVQKIVAAIQFFTTLPLPDRLRLARQYTAQYRAKQGESGPLGCPGSPGAGSRRPMP